MVKDSSDNLQCTAAISETKAKQIVQPTWPYHKMDDEMVKNNPQPYPKVEMDVKSEEIPRKLSIWASIIYILRHPPFFKK